MKQVIAIKAEYVQLITDNALIKKYDFESLKFDKFASLISFKDSLYEYF